MNNLRNKRWSIYFRFIFYAIRCRQDVAFKMECVVLILCWRLMATMKIPQMLKNGKYSRQTYWKWDFNWNWTILRGFILSKFMHPLKCSIVMLKYWKLNCHLKRSFLTANPLFRLREFDSISIEFYRFPDKTTLMYRAPK